MIQIRITYYTDGDFWFRCRDDQEESEFRFKYCDRKFVMGEDSDAEIQFFNADFKTEQEAIEFLDFVREHTDVSYTHDWGIEELDKMFNEAKEFITGFSFDKHNISSTEDGNWSGTEIIVIKD